jgi:hypothetical protein
VLYFLEFVFHKATQVYIANSTYSFRLETASDAFVLTEIRSVNVLKDTGLRTYGRQTTHGKAVTFTEPSSHNTKRLGTLHRS